jgi:hypothetical protein
VEPSAAFGSFTTDPLAELTLLLYSLSTAQTLPALTEDMRLALLSAASTIAAGISDVCHTRATKIATIDGTEPTNPA